MLRAYEAWICEVGDGPDERIIYRGDDLDDLTTAIHANEDEVDINVNKYFLVNDKTFDYVDDFEKYKHTIKPW